MCVHQLPCVSEFQNGGKFKQSTFLQCNPVNEELKVSKLLTLPKISIFHTEILGLYWFLSQSIRGWFYCGNFLLWGYILQTNKAPSIPAYLNDNFHLLKGMLYLESRNLAQIKTKIKFSKKSEDELNLEIQSIYPCPSLCHEHV